MLSIHEARAVDQLSRSLRIDPYRLKRLRVAFYKKQLTHSEALEQLPAEAMGPFARAIEFHALSRASLHDSQVDGASKLIFQTGTGQWIESVILRIASGRTSLCISSQAGCAAACAFCATGRMGLSRNLSASEILDQIVQSNQLLKREGRQVRNLVFMGMGEPFHNEENLGTALEVLLAPDGFAWTPGRVLVSTVGIPEAMVRCARRFPGVNQALSLHCARQEVRQEIIPMARRHGLEELRQALREVTALRGGEPVMIEYILLKDLNDTDADVTALKDYLEGIPVHLNLIPFNPIPGAESLAGTGVERREAFARALKGHGFKVTTRYSLGRDIAAACGQLVRERVGRRV